MISVREAKKLIYDHAAKLQAITVPLEEAAGRILAEDVYAICDIPAFRQSSMDGYAFKFEENVTSLKLVGEMAAGTTLNASIGHGEAYRIFTGAPLPLQADTVIMQEKVSLENDKVVLLDPNLKKGLNAREKGSEIKLGDLAIGKGSLMTPAAMGFLAGIGIDKVSIVPSPKIAIILTGNELQQPGSPLAFGQVYESNSFALTAALNQMGITGVEILTAKDDLETLTHILGAALQTHDMVLLTGGVSVGDYDFVIQATSLCGVKQIFHKVKQKPGKPLYFGKKENKLVFGLPGNPSSVLSCFYNYVFPAIGLLNNSFIKVKIVTAILIAGYRKPSGLTHFLKSIYHEGKAKPLGAQDSYRMSSFAQANCLICLDEEATEFFPGDEVCALLLPN
ncbi:gephyrin-like molybdotransferase Glp [Pedobacter sp.]|uniref:molybdopterin molybdotransferase MoeA n=1 Tax=Pedobacter sp. TaxID=1411316 RepID=UPI003BAB67FE